MTTGTRPGGSAGPTLAHRLEYGCLVAGSRMLRALPEVWALRIGGALGWVVGSVLRIRRSVVEENLTRAFPGLGSGERRRVASRAYRHLGREGAAILRMRGDTPAQVRERTEVVGLERVRGPLEEGRGVLILTGHLGNWEIGGAATAAYGIPLDVVARRQKNPLFDRDLVRTREALGMRVIDRQGATRQILRALREPRAVAVVADQNAPTGDLFVEFFGTPAASERGPSLLAGRTGASVVVAIVHRRPGAPARYRLSFHPLDEAPGEDGVAFTRAYFAALEEAIREAPEQYFWFHRRWKRTPPPAEESGEEPGPARAVPEPPSPPHPGRHGPPLEREADVPGSDPGEGT